MSSDPDSIPTWFNDPCRIEALRSAAAAWLGTPWSPNACCRGRGASCQKFAAALLREAGFWQIEVPEAPMAHARFSRASLVEPWLDARPEFARLPMAGVIRPEVLRPGDVLGFKIGWIIHHLGIWLGDGQFVHCIEHLGVCVCPLADPTWAGRLAAVWRPLENEGFDIPSADSTLKRFNGSTIQRP